MAAIASGSSWGRTFFHKEGKSHSNTEKYEKEISSNSLEKWSIFHLKSKGDEIGTISRESKNLQEQNIQDLAVFKWIMSRQ